MIKQSINKLNKILLKLMKNEEENKERINQIKKNISKLEDERKCWLEKNKRPLFKEIRNKQND
ncbi:hypothetical protein HYO11_18745 [Vibrio parahaemolyticus]|nr:hypothetical protein [Vibrio parahaemolyticus]